MLSHDEAKKLYDTVVAPSGHPDPLGVMARAMYWSGWEEDFIGDDGRVGFNGLKPEIVEERLEQPAPTLSDPEQSTAITVLCDMKTWSLLQDVGQMIVATDFNDEEDHASYLKNIDDIRETIRDIMIPPLMTADDILDALINGEYAANDAYLTEIYKAAKKQHG